MNKDELKGKAQKTVGGVEADVGEALGDQETHVGGRAREAIGAATKTAGQAREVVSAVEKMAAEQPLMALLVAGLLGFLFALLTR